jgi:hypothetical protein
VVVGADPYWSNAPPTRSAGRKVVTLLLPEPVLRPPDLGYERFTDFTNPLVSPKSHDSCPCGSRSKAATLAIS